MTLKVNHNELSELIKNYYKSKISLFVWGRFGIGKSACVKKSGIELAKAKGKEYVEWNKLTEADRNKVYENPEKYFVLIDIRLSEYDSSDIKGLPLFKGESKAIEFRIPFWACLLEKPNSDGILFFDEINLATPIVVSSCYKIIYDRIINESKINDNWLIIGCGNTAEDRAYTHEISPPLKDRCGEVELELPSVDSWCGWATQNNIDSRIIGYVNFKSGSLYVVNFDDNQKFTTYRGWERVNSLINGNDDYKQIQILTASAIGEGIATEFLAFCRIKDKIDINALIKEPSKLKSVEDLSIKYFLISALAEKYKDGKATIDNIFGVSFVLDELNNSEFVALLWRLCYNYASTKFTKDFMKDNKDTKKFKLVEKYASYIQR